MKIYVMVSYSLRNLFFLFLVYSLHVDTVNMLTFSTATLCHDHERSALLHFKQSLSLEKSASYDSSAFPKTESWKVRGESNTSDCCSWYGVECNDNTGYVIGLDLSSSLLYGTLLSNNTVFSLVHLQSLNLADNNFLHSPIPSEMVHLSSLARLDLSSSGFSGQIPLELSELSKLNYLDLSGNDLYGSFPSGIFNLPELRVLNVSDNQNLTGYISEFNKTRSLRALELASTNFYGNLPLSIGNLQSLTKLELGECNFSGSIPASLGNLTQLTYLSLHSNMFHYSSKLSWLHELTKLTFLDLYFMNLYGYIPPSLSNLTHLTLLNLGSNELAGQIPDWLMNMTHLTDLGLERNLLTGPIPSSFSQLKNLKYLSLLQNNLVGTVDADIFLSLRKLTTLDLSENNITLVTHHRINFSTLPKLEILELTACNLREIPYFLVFQKNLKLLYLNRNNIRGKIPSWIWNASDHLNTIDLSANFLTAIEQNPITLPSKSLRGIDLSDNMLEGNLPVPPPNLVQYSMSNNSLTGHIPPMICGSMYLKLLDLSNNNMSGPIPQCLVNSLEALNLQNNNFSGSIPQTYPKNCDLKVMDLSQNELTGKVPKSLSNCQMLQILDISNNQMEQAFPAWLGTLPLLQVLLMNSNKFYGSMESPGISSKFPVLRIIDLSHNFLTGELPVNYIQIWNAMKIFRSDMEPYITTDAAAFGSDSEWRFSYHVSMTLMNKGVMTEYRKILNILSAINLSSNKFTGQIPIYFGSLEALQLLDLSNNDLTGPIPPSLVNLIHLESLDLSHNKLSGYIPQQLATQLIFLAFFNVSCNLLSGPIPQGPQFETFDNDSYVENSGLCGFPLSEHCVTAQSPQTDDHDDFDYELPSIFNWIFIFAGFGSGLVFGFVMGNIVTDRQPWLIGGIVQNFERMQKNRRRPKRQIIRD